MTQTPKQAPKRPEWAYTTEHASLTQVQALNQLLAHPATEGLTLQYPDDD